MALNQQEASRVKSLTNSALVAIAGLDADAILALVDKTSHDSHLLDNLSPTL